MEEEKMPIKETREINGEFVEVWVCPYCGEILTEGEQPVTRFSTEPVLWCEGCGATFTAD